MTKMRTVFALLAGLSGCLEIAGTKDLTVAGEGGAGEGGSGGEGTVTGGSPDGGGTSPMGGGSTDCVAPNVNVAAPSGVSTSLGISVDGGPVVGLPPGPTCIPPGSQVTILLSEDCPSGTEDSVTQQGCDQFAEALDGSWDWTCTVDNVGAELAVTLTLTCVPEA